MLCGPRVWHSNKHTNGCDETARILRAAVTEALGSSLSIRREEDGSQDSTGAFRPFMEEVSRHSELIGTLVVKSRLMRCGKSLI